MNSLRLAARSLARAPVFTLAVVASLGITIAAITTVFSLAAAVLFRALPFREPDALVWIGSVRPTGRDAPFSLPEFMDYRERARTVDIVGFTSWSGAMATRAVARRLQGMRISANAFEVLGAVPTAGRLFRPGDDRPEAARVVLLSHAFWRDHFGGAAGAIGQVIRLNDHPHQIVGVMPRHFPLPLRNVDVVVPLQPDLDARRHVRSSVNFLRLLGRLDRSASSAGAAQELSGIAVALRAEYPNEYASKLAVAVTPMQEYLVGGTRQSFVMMLGAGGLLLGLALANVLNLLIIRGVAKHSEVAVRQALGGSTRHLVCDTGVEAVLLAGAGALVGTLLARWLVALVAGSDIGIPRLDEARVAGPTLALVSAIATVATGLFSALQLGPLLRTTPRQLLSGGGRGLHGSRREARVRGALLVIQLGLAVLLTIVTAAMAESLVRLQTVRLGFRPDSVLLARLALPPRKFLTVAALSRFAEQLEQELLATPGVAAAGAISIAPFSGNLSIIPFTIEGRPPAHEGERLEAHYRQITPGYLPAIGAALRTGRGFGPTDTEGSVAVALISDALARRYFSTADPLGRRLLIDDNDTGPRPVTIVGVVENIRHVTLDGPEPLDIYLPMAQSHPDGLGFIISSHFWAVRSAPPADPSGHLAEVLERMDPDIALARVQPMKSYVQAHLASRKFSVVALLGFALVALVLATIGVYGVVAYSVAQRQREIGLRLALGARGQDVTRTFVVPALRLALLGVGIGVFGALLTRRLVAGLLFGVTPTDPVILGAVGAILTLTSAVAAAIPARRAARIDPMTALLDR